MSDKVQSVEELNKSMDQLIDEFFSEEAVATASETEKVEKSEEPKAEEKKEGATTASLEKASDAVHEIIGEAKQAKEEKDPNKNPATLADDAGNNPPKSEEDEKEGKKRGRPSDLSQMSQRDMSTGESKGSYDASIVEASKNPSMPEASQVQPPEHMKKADVVEISREEYEALKKAQSEALVKAEVEKATSEIRRENEDLRKQLNDTTSLVKALAKRPQPRKSISSVAALEKGGYSEVPESKEFSKSEKLDAAEALVKSGDLSDEDLIELETTGTLLDGSKRSKIERKLNS